MIPTHPVNGLRVGTVRRAPEKDEDSSSQHAILTSYRAGDTRARWLVSQDKSSTTIITADEAVSDWPIVYVPDLSMNWAERLTFKLPSRMSPTVAMLEEAWQLTSNREQRLTQFMWNIVRKYARATPGHGMSEADVIYRFFNTTDDELVNYFDNELDQD